MCVGVRFTEKKITNHRYRNTEIGFLEEFLSKSGNTTVTEMARAMGVARSTFYYHHKKVVEMVKDYKIYILDDYRRMAQRMFEKNVTMTKVFSGMLIFMINHRQVFQILILVGKKDIFLEMVMVLRPKVERFARLSKKSEKIFSIYAYEVAGVLKIWVEEGMKEEEIKVVVDDLVFLTETINERLGKLKI